MLKKAYDNVCMICMISTRVILDSSTMYEKKDGHSKERKGTVVGHTDRLVVWNDEQIKKC